MSDNFLEQIIKRFPNHYQLGSAINHFFYFKKENPNLSQEEAEKIFIQSDFQIKP